MRSFNIIAWHVLASSGEIMPNIVILTEYHVVTLSSRFREESQNMAKELS